MATKLINGERVELSLDEAAALEESRKPPSEADQLAKWRTRATTTRTRFCIAAKRLGMLTPEEAILAARGGWPQSFADALGSLPAEIDADEAQIVWAATTEVHRNDPVLNAVATANGFTPEHIDELFQ